MLQLVARAAEYALLGWLGILAAIVFLGLLRGDIDARGMLSTVGRAVDPERVQNLLIFAFVVGAYIVLALDAPADSRSLPDLPDALLVLLAGSNGVYLSGKLTRSVTDGESARAAPGRSTGSR